MQVSMTPKKMRRVGCCYFPKTVHEEIITVGFGVKRKGEAHVVQQMITNSEMQQNLHKRDEEIAQETAALLPEHQNHLSLEETSLILHELRVHQIELEM
jgi:hypothetical protein